MYYYNPIIEKQQKLQKKYLPQEIRFRQLIKYVDNENPKAMEQLVIFMCWFNKNLGQTRTNKILQIVQKIRMTNGITLHAKKLQAIQMYFTNHFNKTQICDRIGVSRTALNHWIDQAKGLNIRILNFSESEYKLIDEFMTSFDKLCRARNLVKGTLDYD